jgi:hypothetical protein
MRGDCKKMLIEPNTIQQTKFGHFFADGKSSKDTDTSVILGTAYRNTYEQTVHGLSDSAFEPNRSLLETTVITHGTYIRFD